MTDTYSDNVIRKMVGTQIISFRSIFRGESANFTQAVYLDWKSQMTSRGKMPPRIILLVTMLALMGGAARGADLLAGNWKTEGGETAMIARCGADYCITAKSGKFAGQQLGYFSGAADVYRGRLTDPQNKATYSGKLTLSGDSLMLQGCATTVLCKTQTWTRLK
jgi:uncharacterized protein (DUF2147 family)